MRDSGPKRLGSSLPALLEQVDPNLIRTHSGMDEPTGKGLCRGHRRWHCFPRLVLSVLEGALQERPRPHEILSTARAPVIDAEKNIFTNPSSGFYYEISTPAFLFFPKVKTRQGLGT